MQTADQLARYAAMAADHICVDDVESFAIQKDFTDNYTKVTFRLTSGKTRSYGVVEMDDEPRLAASLSPSSS